MRCISWFGGIGGFDLALREHGHEIVGYVERDAGKRRCYASHFPMPAWAPWDAFTSETAATVPEADLWVASSGIDGLRWMMRMVAMHRPTVVLLESGPRGMPDWTVPGYVVLTGDVDSTHCGSAQRRVRPYLIATHLKWGPRAIEPILRSPRPVVESLIVHPDPSTYPSVEDAEEAQGFPRGYTKLCGDRGARLRALGAAPDMHVARAIVAALGPSGATRLLDGPGV